MFQKMSFFSGQLVWEFTRPNDHVTQRVDKVRVKVKLIAPYPILITCRLPSSS